MHSTHNQELSIVAEKFIQTVKNKIYKYMTSLSQNLYIDKLAGKEYNNAYHSTNKIKPVHLNSITFIESNLKINDKDLTLEWVIM